MIFVTPFKKMLFSLLRRALSRRGFHIIAKHYYQPIPDESDLAAPFLKAGSAMIGVDFNEATAVDLLKRIFPPYLTEFRADLPNEQPLDGSAPFWLINGTFMAIDAHVYYAFIRHFHPRRIIEIGGGNSSVLAGIAVERNRRGGGAPAQLTVIEPYPDGRLLRGFPGLSNIVRARVQEVSLEIFGELQAGDILFIDSSHVLRSGGDVQYEYLEILPRLAPGVLVHIHDISLPKPYPSVYAEQELYWNEQYLLQAFLAFNNRFEIIWPGNWLLLRRAEELEAAFPELQVMRSHFPQSEPTSFWIRVRESST